MERSSWPVPTAEPPHSGDLERLYQSIKGYGQVEPESCTCQCETCKDEGACSGFECECECDSCEGEGCTGHSCDCGECERDCPGCEGNHCPGCEGNHPDCDDLVCTDGCAPQR